MNNASFYYEKTVQTLKELMFAIRLSMEKKMSHAAGFFLKATSCFSFYNSRTKILISDYLGILLIRALPLPLKTCSHRL